MDFLRMAQEKESYTIQNRRYLHENPEITWHEFHTLSFIKSELDKMQIEYEEIKYGGKEFFHFSSFSFCLNTELRFPYFLLVWLV